jgi:hypothetical protein
MKIAPKTLTIAAACLVLGGLAMGAAPRVTAPAKASSKAAVNPFAPKAPSAAVAVVRGPVTSTAPGENNPPGNAVRKHRPPVRPVHRPAVRSPFRPTPRR